MIGHIIYMIYVSISRLGYTSESQCQWKWGDIFDICTQQSTIATMMGGATDSQQYTRVEDYMRSIPWQHVLEKVYI